MFGVTLNAVAFEVAQVKFTHWPGEEMVGVSEKLLIVGPEPLPPPLPPEPPPEPPLELVPELLDPPPQPAAIKSDSKTRRYAAERNRTIETCLDLCGPVFKLAYMVKAVRPENAPAAQDLGFSGSEWSCVGELRGPDFFPPICYFSAHLLWIGRRARN